jgi:hypothetical protein
MVGAEDCEGTYRSLEDAPAHVRARLERSTSGPNCATIIIADRRGRREILQALGEQAQAGAPAVQAPRLTPFLKVAFLILLLMLILLGALAAVALRWP